MLFSNESARIRIAFEHFFLNCCFSYFPNSYNISISNKQYSLQINIDTTHFMAKIVLTYKIAFSILHLTKKEVLIKNIRSAAEIESNDEMTL